jgi:hypothetical protein
MDPLGKLEVRATNPSQLIQQTAKSFKLRLYVRVTVYSRLPFIRSVYPPVGSG